MKKLFSVILITVLCVSMVACGNSNSTEENASEQVEANTIGTKLAADFKSQVKANESATAIEIADALLTNEVIDFGGASMEVEPGLLNGFGNAEITGFSEGAMFAPMIGSIPFVGYIFTLDDASTAADFTNTLKSNADLRWNICTEADEMVVETEGNKVFFVMCPTSFEEEM